MTDADDIEVQSEQLLGGSDTTTDKDNAAVFWDLEEVIARFFRSLGTFALALALSSLSPGAEFHSCVLLIHACAGPSNPWTYVLSLVYSLFVLGFLAMNGLDIYLWMSHHGEKVLVYRLSNTPVVHCS